MSSKVTKVKETPIIFSALIEIVGIHDLAEEDTEAYTNRAGIFRSSVSSKLTSYQGVEMRSWIDCCFLQTAKPSDLVRLITDIREDLLTETQPIFLRASAKEGPAFSAEKYEKDAAILEGRVQRLKAAAIEIDETLRDAVLLNDRSCKHLFFPKPLSLG